MDKSRKQSYDEQINELIEYLNRNPVFETTSSCSGRIILYQKSPHTKKGCHWLYTTHEYVELPKLKESLSNLNEAPACVKYEPFILHCKVLDLENAKKLHFVAVSSGYRESGISISNKGKIMVAVRSSQNMDVPIADTNGKLMVTEEYLEFLSNILNEKMSDNITRRERFFRCLKETFPEAPTITQGDGVPTS